MLPNMTFHCNFGNQWYHVPVIGKKPKLNVSPYPIAVDNSGRTELEELITGDRPLFSSVTDFSNISKELIRL